MDLVIISLLVLASIVGLTIIIERGIALREQKVMPSEIKTAVESCQKESDLPMLKSICERNRSTLGRLILFAEAHRRGTMAETVSALETRARMEISKLERGLVILEINVGVAPLLGLVGTIYGLISLFASMGDVGSGNSNELAKGISIALNATLLGLLTAIPSLVAWSYYSRKIDALSIEMASICEDFLRRQSHKAEAETEPTLVTPSFRRK